MTSGTSIFASQYVTIQDKAESLLGAGSTNRGYGQAVQLCSPGARRLAANRDQTPARALRSHRENDKLIGPARAATGSAGPTKAGFSKAVHGAACGAPLVQNPARCCPSLASLRCHRLLDPLSRRALHPVRAKVFFINQRWLWRAHPARLAC